MISPLLRKEFYSLEPDNLDQINSEINLLIIGGSQGAKLFDSELQNLILKISKNIN